MVARDGCRQRRGLVEWRELLDRLGIYCTLCLFLVLCAGMYFEIIGEITDSEIIAKGRAIRELARLRRKYDPGRWRNSKDMLPSGSKTAASASQKSIGTKPTASAENDSRSSGSWTKAMRNTPALRFAICLKNKGCEDLVVRKVYPVLPDERAEREKHLRVVDESGEDYLYPASYFFVIELPQKVERALRQKVPVAA